MLRRVFLFLAVISLATSSISVGAAVGTHRINLPEHPLGHLYVESRVPDVSVVNAVFLPQNDAVKVVIENGAELAITAWSAEIRQVGNPAGSILRFSEDYFRRFGWIGEPATVGLPPQAQSILEIPLHIDNLDQAGAPYTVEISFAAVILEDTTHAGEPKLAERLYEARARGYASLTLLEKTYDEGMHTLALPKQQVLEDLARIVRTALDEDDGAATETVRNFPFVIQEAGQQEAFSNLSLLDWVQGLRMEKQTIEQHTPSVYLGTEFLPQNDRSSPVSPRRHRVPVLDHNTNSCDVLASRTAETEGCGNSNDGTITVKESWSFTCEPYDSLKNKGTLTGNGSCLAGVECWPYFSEPIKTIDSSEGVIRWNRTVTDHYAAFPTLRCISDTSRALDHECPCPDSDCLKLGVPEESLQDTCDSDYPDCSPTEECPTPILLDVRGNGFRLVGLDKAVQFDIDADGTTETLSWTASSADDAFLALDRNANGRIDHGGELFGNVTAQPAAEDPNGFLALAVFDQPSRGGLLDGQIDSRDGIFEELLLWQDTNHDGISQPEELRRLADSNLQAIGLEYFETRRRDQHGNQFRWSSWLSYGDQRTKKLGAVDVILVSDPE